MYWEHKLMQNFIVFGPKLCEHNNLAGWKNSYQISLKNLIRNKWECTVKIKL